MLQQLAQPPQRTFHVEDGEVDVGIAQAGAGTDHTTIATRAQRAVERRLEADMMIGAGVRLGRPAIDLQIAECLRVAREAAGPEPLIAMGIAPQFRYRGVRPAQIEALCVVLSELWIQLD